MSEGQIEDLLATLSDIAFNLKMIHQAIGNTTDTVQEVPSNLLRELKILRDDYNAWNKISSDRVV
jgi:hypothetical protein